MDPEFMQSFQNLLIVLGVKEVPDNNEPNVITRRTKAYAARGSKTSKEVIKEEETRLDITTTLRTVESDESKRYPSPGFYCRGEVIRLFDAQQIANTISCAEASRTGVPMRRCIFGGKPKGTIGRATTVGYVEVANYDNDEEEEQKEEEDEDDDDDDDVEVFNIPRKQAASTSGTKFELAETYSYEEFASRVVPQRALRHLSLLLARLVVPPPYCPMDTLGERAGH
ncbi:hypothetical protein M0804_010381 [Polistes exclamans]|nr:hypothetical protein M0804_010381 [Polistes exclamans]